MKLRNKKWSLGLFICLLIFGTVLAGCSNSDKSASGGNSDSGKKVTLTLSMWSSSPAEKKQLDNVLASFHKENPNITVKTHVIADQYMDVIKTELIGGKAGDVFYLDASEAPAMIKQGVIQPLDGYVKKSFDVSDFEKPLLDAFKGKDGKMYGFPKDYSTLSLFYNKKMFQEAGISSPPKTWDELEADAKKLTKANVYGLGVQIDLARLYNIAQSTGGEVVKNNQANFADPKVVSALKPLIDMHLNQKTLGRPEDSGTKSTSEMFGQQKAAMVFEGPWTIPYLKESFPDLQYGVAELPTIHDKKSTMAYTVAYVMNKASQHKEASWKLISYLTGKKGMKQWTKDGIALPTRKSVAKELGYDKDPLRGPFIAGANYATVWQAGVNLPTITNNFNNQFTSAYIGDQPLAKALKKGQKTANDEIKNQ